MLSSSRVAYICGGRNGRLQDIQCVSTVFFSAALCKIFGDQEFEPCGSRTAKDLNRMDQRGTWRNHYCEISVHFYAESNLFTKNNRCSQHWFTTPLDYPPNSTIAARDTSPWDQPGSLTPKVPWSWSYSRFLTSTSTSITSGSLYSCLIKAKLKLFWIILVRQNQRVCMYCDIIQTNKRLSLA